MSGRKTLITMLGIAILVLVALMVNPLKQRKGITLRIKDLGSDDNSIRFEAFGSLYQMGTEAVPSLVSVIRDDNLPQRIRVDALQIVVAGQKCASLSDLLLSLLDDKEWRIRFSAANYLWLLESERAAPPLCHRWSLESNKTVKREIAVSCAKFGKLEQMPAFEESHRSSNDRVVRLFSAIVLYRMKGGDEYYNVIASGFKDQHKGMRTLTAFTVGDVWWQSYPEDTRISALLEEALQGDSNASKVLRNALESSRTFRNQLLSGTDGLRVLAHHNRAHDEVFNEIRAR